MRVALYGRVSGHDQDRSETIETQKYYLEQHFRSKGDEIVDWYPDADVQYWVPVDERPEGGRLLRDAARRRFDAVGIYSLGRWSRSPEVFGRGKAILKQCGVQLLCLNASTADDSPGEEFSLNVRLLVEKLERDTIARNCQDGRYRRASQGGYVGGVVPYGYQPVPDPDAGRRARKLALDPEEARWVRQIVEWFLTDRASCVEIARRLNRLGVPTACAATDRHRVHRGTQVNTWHDSTIHNILTHPIYYHGAVQFGRSGSRTPVPSPAPALFDTTTWSAVQDQLHANTRGSRRNAHRDYLLRGLIWCDTCQRTLQGRTEKSGRKEFRYYKCPGNLLPPKGHGPGHCPLPWIRADEIEEQAWDQVKALIDNHEDTWNQILHQLIADEATTAGLHSAADGIRGAIHKKQTALKRIVVLATEGLLTPDELREQRARLDNEIATLAAEAERIDRDIEALQHQDQHITRLRDQIRTWGAHHEDLDTPAKRREAVEGILDRIILRPDGEEIDTEYALVYHPASRDTLSPTECTTCSRVGFKMGSLRLFLAGVPLHGKRAA